MFTSPPSGLKPGSEEPPLDAILIGAGIMSATLGTLIARLQPDWSIEVLERLGEPAGESSNAWNNAGTGHSGLCELNYMPDPSDPAKAVEISYQFHLSRQFWGSLAETGELKQTPSFVNPTPHMDVVFGKRDIEYLRQRHATLHGLPEFSAMEYTEDPQTVNNWAPLMMRGRMDSEPIAATRYAAGTDVDFGALTRELLHTMTNRGARIRTSHDVTSLQRMTDGTWLICGRNTISGIQFQLRSRFVFVGAGGYALRLLQKARVPEVRGYAVFPLGAQFLHTEKRTVVDSHNAKVYSQAAIGAPPMSVPHLDRRVVDGCPSLMFGPYATFSTRLLKHGKLTDLFATIRFRNVAVLLAVGIQNISLVRYLFSQLLSSKRRKFAALQRFYPEADPADWKLIQAGQRAQLVKPHPRKVGMLTFGTEVITSAEGSIAGLLGASPGASVAPSVMTDVLAKCFPSHIEQWMPALKELMPALTPITDPE
jgi:malate dehydrogenase (quinone)